MYVLNVRKKVITEIDIKLSQKFEVGKTKYLYLH